MNDVTKRQDGRDRKVFERNYQGGTERQYAEYGRLFDFHKKLTELKRCPLIFDYYEELNNPKDLVEGHYEDKGDILLEYHMPGKEKNELVIELQATNALHRVGRIKESSIKACLREGWPMIFWQTNVNRMYILSLNDLQKINALNKYVNRDKYYHDGKKSPMGSRKYYLFECDKEDFDYVDWPFDLSNETAIDMFIEKYKILLEKLLGVK